jgi:hypothetical protein
VEVLTSRSAAILVTLVLITDTLIQAYGPANSAGFGSGQCSSLFGTAGGNGGGTSTGNGGGSVKPSNIAGVHQVGISFLSGTGRVLLLEVPVVSLDSTPKHLSSYKKTSLLVLRRVQDFTFKLNSNHWKMLTLFVSARLSG